MYKRQIFFFSRYFRFASEQYPLSVMTSCGFCPACSSIAFTVGASCCLSLVAWLTPVSYTHLLTNLLNQHAVTSYWESLDSNFTGTPLFSANGGIFGGALFYQNVEEGYSPQQQITSSNMILNSLYGKPNLWQLSRLSLIHISPRMRLTTLAVTSV